MKVMIDGHRAIFSYLYLGNDLKDEVITMEGVVYSRISKFLVDGQLKTKRVHGYRVGVIIALDDGRMGYSVMDDIDFYGKPSLQSINRPEAFRRAYEHAKQAPEWKASHRIPRRFRAEWDEMEDRRTRYFGKGQAKDDPVTWEPINDVILVDLEQ